MKIIKLFTLFVILLFSPKIMSQEFKLGKVSVAELEQKFHPKDSSAAAAILYKKGKTRIDYDQNIGFVTYFDVETRIKIYKKEGYNWANQAIWYYNSTDFKEKVSVSDAVTFNLVGGKIEATKLKSDGIFDEAVSKFRSQKKITLPNVKEGSVIEFKYSVRSPDVLIRDWDFQTNIPVNYSEFKTFVPEYFVFTPAQKGYIFPKVISEKSNKSFIINSKERSGTGGFGGGATQTEFYQDKIEYIEMQTTYLAENFAAMKDEAYVNNIENYMSSVSHELSMTRFPNKPIKQLSTDWNSVVKTIYDYDDFGPELNKTGYFEEDVKKLLAETKTPEEKIWAIFNHVKSNVKWNSYTGYNCDNGVKKAYKEKTGNIADINLMLTAMLRYSGLTANPVLVSTRSNGIALFPNRTAYNYVITAVETPNGYILLDASEKFSTPNILPLRVLNWYGRLIRKDGTSEEINLMPEKTSADNVFLTYSIEADGKVTGKTRRQSADYNAMLLRDNISNLKEEEYLEKLENTNNKIEISDYSKTNEKDILLPIVETYSFTGNNLCELIGEKIYVSPMLFFTNDKNPFKQDIREYPVDFSYPFADKYNITIKIPDGFAVETLPAPAAVVMEDDLGAFKFNIVANENVLQLSILHQINAAIISAEKYEMLKEYYKAMIAKETEKIVLKRI
ncbi:transglutaminase domain-containing protein [Flavobacterium anhuiense]|uniref:transglutaminase domain-containing protein n=1 Tax=Flavobacterium anhuiense TaxID=459526 RepID=UPI003D96A542